jgi:hypothetical protein
MKIKKRDWNIVGIAKGEINAKPKVVKSKKAYSRKIKHKNKVEWA